MCTQTDTNQENNKKELKVLGLGTPASNGGLKAGDVLVQVELQLLLMIEQREKTTMMPDADTFLQIFIVLILTSMMTVPGGEQAGHDVDPPRGCPVHQVQCQY